MGVIAAAWSAFQSDLTNWVSAMYGSALRYTGLHQALRSGH